MLTAMQLGDQKRDCETIRPLGSSSTKIPGMLCSKAFTYKAFTDKASQFPSGGASSLRSIV